MGEALRPLLSKVRGEVPAPTVRALVTTEFLGRRLRDLERAAERVELVVEGLMRDVIAVEDAPDEEVFRAVARLECRLDDLLESHAKVRHADADDRYVEGRDLLAETHRHLLGQIESWLEDLVETIADPIAAVERKGLPTSGYVEIPFVLTMDAPPQLGEFRRWVDRMRRLVEGPDDCSGDGVVIYLQESGSERVPPAHLERTSDAMRPLLQWLSEGIRQTSKPGWLSPKVTGDFISGHLHRLADVGERLEDAVDSLMSDVIAAPELDDGVPRRVLARVGSCIDELVAGYKEVRAGNASGPMVEGRTLLASDYRHVLEQIAKWLRETIKALRHPLAAYESENLPASGRIRLPIGLRLTVPPAVDGLRDWAEDLRLRNEADAAFWGTAFAVALGAWVGCGLFDD